MFARPVFRSRSRLSRSAGFTLIELLVVIVIIATLAGMAVLSLGSSGARAWNSEAQRLASVLQLVADRAVIDKAHYGMVLETDSYKVVRYDAASMTWQAPESDGSRSGAARFAAHQLPENMRLEVLEEAEMPRAEGGDDDDNLVPQFVALSTGEVLPVELALLLLEDREIARAASITYSSLNGLQLQWQSDDF